MYPQRFGELNLNEMKSEIEEHTLQNTLRSKK